MEKKGILLAGGTGSRFFPVTKAVNKHFLPIYNKPMFFYPLSILMIGGIKKIQIVSDDESLQGFDKILSEMNLDVEFSYQSQNKPSGIADGILKSEKFLGKSDFVLI
jgi:glucose-1-phosphate thymidylyltransferase